jgi:hypothetical protein
MARAEQHPLCAAVDRSGRRCEMKTRRCPGVSFALTHQLGAEASPKWGAAAGAVREHPKIFGEGRQEKG